MASPAADRARLWTDLATAVAAVAVAGSFGLTFVLGLKPCPLCFYQRSFAMAALGILVVGRMLGLASSDRSVLALTAAAAGLVVAAKHVDLVAGKVLDCPDGFLGLGTAPMQSLVAFVLLLVPLLFAARAARVAIIPGTVAVLLGLAFGVLSFSGNGPMNTTPAPKFDEQGKRILTICEPHWEAPAPR